MSAAAPRLIVPERFGTGKPNPRRTPNPFARFARNSRQVWKGYAPNRVLPEHPGRKAGQLAGTWVSDLAERRKAIVLCDTPCQSKFYYKRAGYYRDGRYGARAVATCDGCKQFTTRGQLYLPEERLVDSSGRIGPGQVWSPV